MAKTIVVVEDDENILTLYEEILSSEGYDVKLARSGKEALEVLNSLDHPPCLVLTDFMMPEMTGGDLVKIMRQDTMYMSIPVVMVSAKPLGEIEERAFDFLKKPVDVDTIIDKVAEYCGKAHEDDRNLPKQNPGSLNNHSL